MDFLDIIFSVLPLAVPITEDQHQMIILLLAAVFSASEALAHIPAIKANSLFQLFFNLLKKIVKAK